ncbi:MAG: YicC/YloC family endoribonuclease [Bacteroidales bacterium]|nr:YicC/YloC family endoribonuclease [Bacteroidales bacterium]
MIQSMTGFGKSVAELSNKKITVEIKSLNSKQLDLSARVASSYREKEMDFRNKISQKLERGKIDFIIYSENIGNETSSKINIPILESYFNQIKDASDRLNVELPKDWFQILLRMPEAIKTEVHEIDEEEMDVLEKTVNEAIDRLIEFRIQEGKMLHDLFVMKIQNIANLLLEVPKYENERIEKIKSKIYDSLAKIEGYEIDKNRFEQEMIYYIEKLDINEEKHRLDNHLKYFIETMDSGHGQGKKLGFICQEMGREINTLGSKSNHAELQKVVVRMKDELEQIKEQILNVL